MRHAAHARRVTCFHLADSPPKYNLRNLHNLHNLHNPFFVSLVSSPLLLSRSSELRSNRTHVPGSPTSLLTSLTQLLGRRSEWLASSFSTSHYLPRAPSTIQVCFFRVTYANDIFPYLVLTWYFTSGNTRKKYFLRLKPLTRPLKEN